MVDGSALYEIKTPLHEQGVSQGHLKIDFSYVYNLGYDYWLCLRIWFLL